VIIDTEDRAGFKITADQLAKAITPRTKMLILTSPSNPTGSVYSREELTALAEVLKGTDIIVVSDEMYEKLVFDGTQFVSTASISEDMFRRTITVNGLSKSVAMTGWRFGYLACASRELVKKMNSLQSHLQHQLYHSESRHPGPQRRGGRGDRADASGVRVPRP